MPANSILEASKTLLSIPPDTHSVGTVNGTAVAISNFRKAEVTLMTRLLGSATTLDVHMEGSTDGTTFTDLKGEDGSTNIAFAQLVDANDNVVRRGLLYLTELAVTALTHIRAVAVIAGAAAEVCVSIRLAEPYEAPVVRDSVAQASGGNAFYAIHGVGAR